MEGMDGGFREPTTPLPHVLIDVADISTFSFVDLSSIPPQRAHQMHTSFASAGKYEH